MTCVSCSVWSTWLAIGTMHEIVPPLAVEGENLSKADIAGSQAALQVKKAEAYELGETRKVRAEAAVMEAEHLARAKAALAGTNSEEYRSLAAALEKPPGTGLVY